MNSSKSLSVSVVIPTLNAERCLASCLESVREQAYDGNVEIIIVDAGSSDATLAITQEFGVERVLDNPKRSGEAGKAIGVKAASGDLVLLLDSDNRLSGLDWLEKMATPFIRDPEVIGCEPSRFSPGERDHFINRWHALLGAADPLTIHTGEYCRDSALTGTWTGCPHDSKTLQGWERVRLVAGSVPVFGANGFLIRRSAYDFVPVDDYLFDVDHVSKLVDAGHTTFARVGVGVRHEFVTSVSQFVAKTRRRIDDYLFFATTGRRSTANKRRIRGVIRFSVSTVLVVPVIAEAVRGYRAAPDGAAWLWHPVACWLTLAVYASGALRGAIRPQMVSRDRWSQ